MSEKPMNIYQKLIEVRKAVPYLQKEAKGHQYNYVASSQVLASVRTKMDEVGLLLIPAVVDKRVQIDGKNIFTELDMEFTWVNAENPEETITRPWYGQGMDTSGEKGVGKALTYAEKYFMLKFFNIATDKDDPDSFQKNDDSKHGSKQEQKPSNVTNISEQLKGTATPPQLKAVHGALDKKKLRPDELAVVLQKFGVTKIEELQAGDIGNAVKEIMTFKVAK